MYMWHKKGNLLFWLIEIRILFIYQKPQVHLEHC